MKDGLLMNKLVLHACLLVVVLLMTAGAVAAPPTKIPHPLPKTAYPAGAGQDRKKASNPRRRDGKDMSGGTAVVSATGRV